MRPAWRILTGISATIAFLGVVRAVTFAQAGSTLQKYVDDHAAEVERENAELAQRTLPPRHGLSSGARCEDAQAYFLASSVLGSQPYRFAVYDWPEVRVPADARSHVEHHAEALTALRSTLTCSHAFTDEGGNKSLRAVLAARNIIVDGLVQAEDGNELGAIERLVDAMRLTEELEAVSGSRAFAEASIALGRVLAKGSDPSSLDQAEASLTLLTPFAPKPEQSLETMKRTLVEVAREAELDPVGSLSVPRYDMIGGMQKVKMRTLLSVLTLLL